MPPDGGRHAVCEHRPAVCRSPDGEVALGTGYGDCGLPATGGNEREGRTEPGTGGGGVLATAESAGPCAGVSGYRGLPTEPSGGADFRSPAGAEALA